MPGSMSVRETLLVNTRRLTYYDMGGKHTYNKVNHEVIEAKDIDEASMEAEGGWDMLFVSGCCSQRVIKEDSMQLCTLIPLSYLKRGQFFQ